MLHPQTTRCISILLALLTILSTTLTAPVQTIEERRILTETHILPRQQQNIPQLLTLASLAGITLPTNPAVLISLAPVAARLQSYLPTSSVLSILETAAPQSFLSNIVHDPAYGASFEQAFAKGSSPSWFLALPTDVKSYLHTYSGYGGVATAVGDFGSVAAGAEGSTSGSGTRGGSAATMTGSGMSSTTSGMSSTTSGKAAASGTSANAHGTTSAPPAGATAGAARSSGVLTVGLAIVVGVLALAVAL